MPFPNPSHVLQTLDRMPKPIAIALGLPLGFSLALAVLSAPLALGAVGFIGLLALAGFIAWGGEPISVAEPADAATVKPEPPPETPKPPEPEDPLWASLPGGSFAMGSNDYDNERPIHTVHISPFNLMRTPVTRKLYLEIIGKDPSWPEGEADGRPVTRVNWLDAVDFCIRWSQAEGLTPGYQKDGDKVTWVAEADGYRLPTEAEWEYACRAGSSTRWCFGDDAAKLTDYAWFDKNSGGEPHPVAKLKSNAWGLFDMHGNVWEWCWDWYGGYSAAEQTDPSGPKEGSSRVLRGGSFLFAPEGLRSAFRYWGWPMNRVRNFGFRCVRGPRRQAL